MKLAIYGYGNLGKGVEYAIGQNPDAVLTGNGAVHGIENTGSDTLTVFAVVVKYAG